MDRRSRSSMVKNKINNNPGHKINYSLSRWKTSTHHRCLQSCMQLHPLGPKKQTIESSRMLLKIILPYRQPKKHSLQRNICLSIKPRPFQTLPTQHKTNHNNFHRCKSPNLGRKKQRIFNSMQWFNEQISKNSNGNSIQNIFSTIRSQLPSRYLQQIFQFK